MSVDAHRSDELGRAYAGSQLQIQTYVNRRQEAFSAAVVKSVPALREAGAHLRWVSPLERDRFAEFRDAEFLAALGQARHAGRLAQFWPSRGPDWDGLAVVVLPSAPPGVLLVEAKSYPDEMRGPGCMAESERSIAMITRALDHTKKWLGVSPDRDWTGKLYQYANRLAHLYFFREICGVQAWLANLCFLNDPHRPTNREEWDAGLTQVKGELGLSSTSEEYVSDIFLSAAQRSELVGG